MKTRNFIGCFVIAGLVLLGGCSKDNKSPKMSDLETDKHKTNFENEGLALMEDMEAMKNLSSLHIIKDFMELDANEGDALAPVLSPIAKLTEGGTSVFGLKSLVVEDPNSFSEMFNQESGIYTYNKVSHEWDYVASPEEITYIFPTSVSTTNNAKISVTDFDCVVSPNQDYPGIDEGEMEVELIKSLKVAVYQSDVEMLTFTLSASYNSDGMPTKTKEVLSMNEGYALTFETSLSGSSLSYNQAFTYKGESLIASHFEVNGDLDYDNLMDNVESEENPDVFEQTVISSANAWFSIKNIKFQGLINIEKLINKMADMEENAENFDSEEAFWEAFAKVCNSNVKLLVKYKDSNEIIAKSEFYAYNDEYDGWDVYFRVVFSDGQPYDMDNASEFFEEGFESLEDAAEDWMNEMDAEYGEEEKIVQ